MNLLAKALNMLNVEERYFKVKDTAPLGQILDKRCEETGLQRDQIRLCFKGTVIRGA